MKKLVGLKIKESIKEHLWGIIDLVCFISGIICIISCNTNNEELSRYEEDKAIKCKILDKYITNSSEGDRSYKVTVRFIKDNRVKDINVVPSVYYDYRKGDKVSLMVSSSVWLTKEEKKRYDDLMFPYIIWGITSLVLGTIILFAKVIEDDNY